MRLRESAGETGALGSRAQQKRKGQRPQCISLSLMWSTPFQSQLSWQKHVHCGEDLKDDFTSGVVFVQPPLVLQRKGCSGGAPEPSSLPLGGPDAAESRAGSPPP